jgi:hypothetical protein
MAAVSLLSDAAAEFIAAAKVHIGKGGEVRFASDLDETLYSRDKTIKHINALPATRATIEAYNDALSLIKASLSDQFFRRFRYSDIDSTSADAYTVFGEVGRLRTYVSNMQPSWLSTDEEDAACTDRINKFNAVQAAVDNIKTSTDHSRVINLPELMVCMSLEGLGASVQIVTSRPKQPAAEARTDNLISIAGIKAYADLSPANKVWLSKKLDEYQPIGTASENCCVDCGTPGRKVLWLALNAMVDVIEGQSRGEEVPPMLIGVQDDNPFEFDPAYVKKLNAFLGDVLGKGRVIIRAIPVGKVQAASASEYDASMLGAKGACDACDISALEADFFRTYNEAPSNSVEKSWGNAWVMTQSFRACASSVAFAATPSPDEASAYCAFDDSAPFQSLSPVTPPCFFQPPRAVVQAKSAAAASAAAARGGVMSASMGPFFFAPPGVVAASAASAADPDGYSPKGCGGSC